MHFVHSIFPLVLLVYLSNSAISTSITFWSSSKGKGKSITSTGNNQSRNCVPVPKLDFEMRSITTDTCIQIFPTTNCVSRTVHQIDSITVNWAKMNPRIQSWIPCRQKAINVIIFNKSDSAKMPLAQFKNLCKCVNIPKELQGTDINLDTENQEVLLYEKENCTGRYVLSQGGSILKSSLEPSSRPSTCPFLNGILIEISNFTLTQTPKIKQMPLQPSPSEVQSSSKQNISVRFTGEDRKYLTFSAFPWTRNLLSCKIKNGTILKQKLSVGTWNSDRILEKGFIESHCQTSDPIDGYYKDQTRKVNQTFVSFRNFTVAAGATTSIYGLRGYATKYYDYKIFLNITGISIDTDIVSADELENSLPQSGLKFVKQLDEFTVLAEAAAFVKSHYPVSTKYWTEVKGSQLPNVKPDILSNGPIPRSLKKYF